MFDSENERSLERRTCLLATPAASVDRPAIVRGAYKSLRTELDRAFAGASEARRSWVGSLDTWAKTSGDIALSIGIDQAARLAFGDVTAGDEFDLILGYGQSEIGFVEALPIASQVIAAGLDLPMHARTLLRSAHLSMAAWAWRQVQTGASRRLCCVRLNVGISGALGHQVAPLVTPNAS